MKWVVDPIKLLVVARGVVVVQRPGHEEGEVSIPLVMDFPWGTSVADMEVAFDEMRKRIEAVPDPWLQYKV